MNNSAVDRFPKISVIISTYNMENRIGVLLESLTASKFSAFEVCIHDDCSTDNTLTIIEQFQTRLTIHLSASSENCGVTSARNRAAENARAPLLLFLDADVRLYEDTISRLNACMESTGADVVDGVYTAEALDDNPFSRYYALFVHHSFLIDSEPVEYNVFNAWCALCKREVWKKTGGHTVISKGVEVENEMMGRRINANGFRIVMDPTIAVDHHWGGHRKLVFIFVQRVYWWIKVFVATGFRFESSLTTSGYGMATLSVAGGLFAGIVGLFFPVAWLAMFLCLGVFFWGYAPFLRFACRKRGLLYGGFSVLLSMYFALYASFSAVYSIFEELFRRSVLGEFTLDAAMFKE
jgi:glycosyltransferase involved in cell wall biosynthesis